MSHTNITFVQGMYAAFSRGDIDTIVQGCTPDIDWKSGGRKEDFPSFGPRKGAAEVRDFFRTIAAELEFSEFSPQEFYADRDKVFVLGRYAATMKKNGNRAGSDWCHVFTFRGGKVEKFHEFADTATFKAAYYGT
jgi:ketosteroid isomerase-like protein